MQNFVVDLESSVSKSFRCQKAADSLDIDIEKKARHHISIAADIATTYNVGLIVGASGSGKTTLAKKIFGENCFAVFLDQKKPIIEQFPESMSYDECAENLSGIGLTSVPCWIRPVETLSNGQKARAEAALAMTSENGITCIDEWTSVVDRTVAKVMSHCVQKYARKKNVKIILNSCHYDVIEWLNPDWIIDCNSQTFTDRRLLCQNIERQEKLTFEIRAVGRQTWKYFSKYHYLSDKLPGGKIFTYGLFHGENQIGFQCFANYVIGNSNIYHSNRTVIHPDYAGLGLGIRMINECSALIKSGGYRVLAKFSSTPVHKSMQKEKKWKLTDVKTSLKYAATKINDNRNKTIRKKVKTFHYEFIG